MTESRTPDDTIFDYPGFRMYGVFGLLVSRPLLRLTLSAKVAAVGLGFFGLLYRILFAGVITVSALTADIGTYIESTGVLLMIPVISVAVYLRIQMKEASNA